MKVWLKYITYIQDLVNLAAAHQKLPSLEKEGCPKGGVVRSLADDIQVTGQERTTPSAETASTPPL